MDDNWHNLEPLDVMIEFDVQRTGLSDTEVITRRGKYGENKLAEPERVPGWKRFLSQYNDPLNYLLIGAAIVALLIHPDEPGDAIFIFMVLTANAYFGYWQEGQAEQARALRARGDRGGGRLLAVREAHDGAAQGRKGEARAQAAQGEARNPQAREEQA